MRSLAAADLAFVVREEFYADADGRRGQRDAEIVRAYRAFRAWYCGWRGKFVKNGGTQ